jgi:hypothetical protein
MAAAALQFTREHLRAPLTLAMLLVLPATFVWLAGDVLDQFAKALGGGELGAGATALGAGWGAAFVCGALGYFQMSSSRDADRRLALAGFGSGHVATSRLLAGLALALLVAMSSLAALMLQTDVAHPWHAAAAIGAFAAIYLALGALVATVIRDQLSGSLVVAFVFLLDTFSGEGMGNASGLPTPSRYAGSLLVSAGVGDPSPGGDWLGAVLTISASAVVAWAAFRWSARERGL